MTGICLLTESRAPSGVPYDDAPACIPRLVGERPEFVRPESVRPEFVRPEFVRVVSKVGD